MRSYNGVCYRCVATGDVGGVELSKDKNKTAVSVNTDLLQRARESLAPKPEPELEIETESEVENRIGPKNNGNGHNHEFQWEDIHRPSAPTSTVRNCIIIDRNSVVRIDIPVDLHGADMSAVEWGYYGKTYPLLIESKVDGMLRPWLLPDKVGRCSSKLYIAEKLEGWRRAWQHRQQTLEKVKIGLMIGLILVLVFFIFLFVKG